MELYRFSPVFFILLVIICQTTAQYNQQTQCQPCTGTQGIANQQQGYATQQNQYSGYGYNGCTRCGNGYQYDQSNQYQNQNQNSYPTQSGSYSSNSGYQNSAYTNQNQQYSNPSNYNYQSQQQGGSMYNINQQQQGYNQYSGSNTPNVGRSDTSQPGYLRDYHGDIYTNPQRIKDTQALNAAFFQGIGGEPKYQGAVDGPQQNSTSQTGK
uniref:Uncharacterized protein n=1 Tax=Panagrolaimus sp. JU765 TaxID=591449 RepID=A0AC34QSR3_9BILA